MDTTQHDKDLLIAKMGHKTTILTATIGGIVTLLGVLIPVGVTTYANQNKNTNSSAVPSQSTDKKVEPSQTTTPTPSPEPTKPGKKGGKEG